MTERAQEFIKNIRSYTAQNDLIVLDKNDLLQLAEELNA